jgi:hypothetical protein
MVTVTQREETPLELGARVLVIGGTQARIVPDYTQARWLARCPPAPALPPTAAAQPDPAAQPRARPASAARHRPRPLSGPRLARGLRAGRMRRAALLLLPCCLRPGPRRARPALPRRHRAGGAGGGHPRPPPRCHRPRRIRAARPRDRRPAPLALGDQCRGPRAIPADQGGRHRRGAGAAGARRALDRCRLHAGEPAPPPQRLRHLEEAFDPLANARYAARFLGSSMPRAATGTGRPAPTIPRRRNSSTLPRPRPRRLGGGAGAPAGARRGAGPAAAPRLGAGGRRWWRLPVEGAERAATLPAAPGNDGPRPRRLSRLPVPIAARAPVLALRRPG